jgi:hypothetical protein
LVKIIGIGLIAAIFTVIGLGIRDWFDEYKVS